jgi:hypothetical protein
MVPVPGGDRPRLADAVTWHHYPIAIGSDSVRALGVLGGARAAAAISYSL